MAAVDALPLVQELEKALACLDAVEKDVDRFRRNEPHDEQLSVLFNQQIVKHCPPEHRECTPSAFLPSFLSIPRSCFSS